MPTLHATICTATTAVLTPASQALDSYEGAVVVISHDRAFCEAIEATHVGYVANGQIDVEERTLRESDFSEADRGVVNVDVAEEERELAAV